MVDKMDRDELERRLQGYFAAERDDVRAPGDLWANVSARLGEQDPAPWWRRVFGGSLQGMSRVYAGAAAAVAVAVVGVVMYAALIGFDGSGGAYDSMASDAPSDSAPAMAAAAPAAAPTPAPATAPEAAAAVAPAADMAAPEAMGDAVPRAPAGSTMNASAAMAEPPFRLEMWGLLNGARTHLFWVDLPQGWGSSEPVLMDGVWSGVFSGPGVMLQYTFGERMQTDMLLASARAEATTTQQRMWDEYVIGNLAFIVAPHEGSTGDLLMSLQLPTGTLRLTGETLDPNQQEWALMIFRSIIA